MSSQIEIVQADALLIPTDTFAHFDALIVDPPYSDHVHENAVSVDSAEGGVRARGFGFSSLSTALRVQIAAATARVKRWSCVFSDIQGVHAWDDACETAGAECLSRPILWRPGDDPTGPAPWVRWSQPQLSGDRPPSSWEVVNLYHAQHIGERGGRRPLKKTWNGPGSLTAFGQRCLRGREKHPTEKPLDLMLAIVAFFSNPGEAVIDLCGGAGTTAAACRLLDRDCVSIELDGAWCDKARERCRTPVRARDLDRAREWVEKTYAEASAVPKPASDDDIGGPAYERAQRRIEDAARVIENLECFK